jgi:hypothetical protein
MPSPTRSLQCCGLRAPPPGAGSGASRRLLGLPSCEAHLLPPCAGSGVSLLTRGLPCCRSRGSRPVRESGASPALCGRRWASADSWLPCCRLMPASTGANESLQTRGSRATEAWAPGPRGSGGHPRLMAPAPQTDCSCAISAPLCFKARAPPASRGLRDLRGRERHCFEGTHAACA